MANVKMSDTLSLDPSDQKKISNEIGVIKKKIQKGEITIKERRKAQKITAEQTRGLIFISHLPHGFYEEELKQYFTQFGKVTNVKVCRSNKSGRSKGFGYIEFSNPEVAKIAGQTMNNYLMFKKRLSVNYIPYEKRPNNLFHGKSSTENKFSAKTRRNKQFHVNVTADESKYKMRTKKRLSRLNKKMKKLSALGIDVPKVTSTETVQILGSELEQKTPDKKQTKLKSKPPPPKNDTKKPLRRSERSSKINLDMSVNIVNPSLAKKEKQATGIVKKKKTYKGSSKQKSKPMPLDADTVRKIARELIRKKGRSLLNFPSTNTKTSKNK